MKYQFFKVEINNHIAQVSFNRPEKANSLHMPAWEEMRTIFNDLHDNPEARVIVLTGEGKHFCAGIDLETLMGIQQYGTIKCEARKREKLRKFILNFQATITAIEDCRKPVIAAIHKACVGGGIDIITACDMRYCTEDTYFSIKEVDLGLVADIGTMQRLPNILNPGIVAELAYTGRKVSGTEAEKIGLTNQSFPTQEMMMEKVMELAAMIASKSPLVIRGTKEMLLYQRDHSLSDALDYMATWNSAMLLSNDLMEAFQATMQKRQPDFEN
ncbi:MAG: crotonase/enoyl-CoA hydratase family protein [Bacteroidetes bacterium]|jgi:enoyl-CoA hydratase|nr:crotonase/enoyl-CoA hydratase family protein [Bacteroidota bacterium]MDF1863613.1 crotonase/enoyl-CoA hydratase family protein [Saprospiraceae bacterium]